MLWWTCKFLGLSEIIISWQPKYSWILMKQYDLLLSQIRCRVLKSVSSWDLRVGLGGGQHLVELLESVIFKTHSRLGPSLILEITFSFHLEYAWKLHPKRVLTSAWTFIGSVDPWRRFKIDQNSPRKCSKLMCVAENRFDSSKLQFSFHLRNIFMSDFTLLHKTINKHVWTWLKSGVKILSLCHSKLIHN